MRSTITRCAAAALVAATTLGLTVATSGTALAWGPSCRRGEVATGFKFTGDGIRIRTRPVANATVVGLGYRGDHLAGGGRNGDFLWIRDYTQGREGWVAGQYVTWICAGQTHPS